MTALEGVAIAREALEDKIGQDICVLDLKGISNLTQYFVIASGNADTHLRAMADEVEQRLFRAGLRLHHSEGYSSGTWILLDFGEFLVHLFNKEQRGFYSLERVWADAKDVK